MTIVSDSVLVESKSARNNQLATLSHDRANEVLNKVKSLYFALWQGVGTATTEQVAEFYEVSSDVVRDNLRRNRDEFESDGLKLLKGKALKDVSEIISLTPDTAQATIWTPRAALRLGMLLRDSEVAKTVRTSLLDAVELVLPTQSSSQPTQFPLLPTPQERLTLLNRTIECGATHLGWDSRDLLFWRDQLKNIAISLTQPALPSATGDAAQRLELPISDRAIQLGYRPNSDQLMAMGRAAAKLYRQTRGYAPVKREQFVAGTTRMVNVYTPDDISILDAAIQAVMGGVN